jgi:GNAT superfamily N-acetyltransferase
MELRPSSELTRPRLAELFTAAYEGYYVPFQVDEARLAQMVDVFDLELARSLVAWDGETPVGLANLGLRGERTWLGGVGVVKPHRRAGIGEQLTLALLDRAREAGAREMVLEVITQNEPAIALYEKLGFRTTRELEVLTLTAAEGERGDDADPAETRRLIAEARTEPEPWQRDDATVDNLPDAAALAVDRAAVVYRMEDERVNLLQAGGEGLGQVVAALRARGPILALNYPARAPATAALHEAGAAELLRQFEMIIDL